MSELDSSNFSAAPETEAKPRCRAFNKKGEPCMAPPMPSGLCSAHSGIATQNLKPSEGGKASALAKKEKQKTEAQKVSDKLRTYMERDFDFYYEMAKKAASQGDWRAFQFLWQSLYGKAAVSIDINSNETFELPDLTKMNAEERDKWRGQLLKNVALHTATTEADEDDSEGDDE